MKNNVNKYQNRINQEDKARILKLHKEEKTNIEISKEIGRSSTAVRMFLKKNGLGSNKLQKRDKSRPCKVCGKVFVPKYDDGINKDKYTNCSIECGRMSISQSNIKYTQQDIDKVIELKKRLFTNKDIVQMTGVNINKVKEIVKDYKLKLTSEQAQKNAYNKKLEKNPNAMQEMRAIFHKQIVSQSSLNEVKSVLKKRGYEYVSGFKGRSNPFIVRCNSCKKTKTTSKINTIKTDSCLNCSNTGNSKQEIEIKEWVQSLGLNTEKYKIKRQEIDIYIPSLKIGIEYCGLYWHNEYSLTPRLKNYHYDKMIKANEEGIRLITIFEDEWLERKDQVKGFLKSVLGVTERRIYARKCEIKELEKSEAQIFLDRYHIQGKAIIKVALGLYFEEELVGLVTGNKHHRQGHNSFVLNRLVFKDGVQVLGGASRLLKHLIKYAKDNSHSKLISWSDNRWSEGRVYRATGFILEEELEPDYSYYVGSNKRISKQSCTKKNLLKKGAKGSMEDKEYELAMSIGYLRIWDCGKKRWVIDLT